MLTASLNKKKFFLRSISGPGFRHNISDSNSLNALLNNQNYFVVGVALALAAAVTAAAAAVLLRLLCDIVKTCCFFEK